MINIYNSDLEVSIRVAKILTGFYPDSVNIEKLICIDFFILNLADFFSDEESLHPAIPRRDTQLAIKRKLFNDSINIMKKYGIVKELYTGNGFLYSVTDKTFSFTNAIKNKYIDRMEYNIRLVKKELGSLSDSELKKLIASKFGRLDSEIYNG
jgi:hypothetical protein